MATSPQWLERTETVYQKRLQKISEVWTSAGTASKRFKGIQSLVDIVRVERFKLESSW